MTMNLIMAAMMYPVLILVFALMLIQSKPRGGLLFGARLMESLAGEPAVEEIRQKFRREMVGVLVILALIPLSFFLVPYSSVQMFLWVLWVYVLLAVICLPYGRANGALRRWKAQSGLVSEREKAIYAELCLVPRTVKWQSFLPQIVLSVLAAVLVTWLLWTQGLGEAIAATVTIALMTPLFALCAVWMDRLRMKVISADSDVNLNYNRAMRSQWKNCWHGCAWINTAYTLATALGFVLGSYAQGMMVVIVGAAVYVVALVVLLVWLLVEQNRLNKHYGDKMDLVGYVDDDENWLWGLVYYNPGDRRLNVEKRFGMGVTINVGTTAGKVISIALAAVLAASLVLCAWPIALEFTPMEVKAEGEYLVASQLREDYVLELDELESVTLLEGHPEWSRVNGTGMPTLLKGTFRLHETGERVEVFMNPENAYCIWVVADGQSYYLACDEDEATLALYQQLNP